MWRFRCVTRSVFRVKMGRKLGRYKVNSISSLITLTLLPPMEKRVPHFTAPSASFVPRVSVDEAGNAPLQSISFALGTFFARGALRACALPCFSSAVCFCSCSKLKAYKVVCALSSCSTEFSFFLDASHQPRKAELAIRAALRTLVHVLSNQEPFRIVVDEYLATRTRHLFLSASAFQFL